MFPRFLPVSLAGLTLLLAACGQREEKPKSAAAPAPSAPAAASTAIVKDSERSRHFDAVNQQLELGGTIYGYVDIDGDAAKVAESLKGLVQNISKATPMAAPFANQDYAALFTKLGFNDVKAFGLSSVPEAGGFYRNRTFFYTPDGRHGLLAGLGGKPGPFAHLKLAPANTDFYSESEIDVPAIYLTVKDVLGQIGGDTAKNALDQMLQSAGEKAMISWLKLINATKGHVVVVARFDADKTFSFGGQGGPAIPAFSLLLRIDGIGSAVEDALKSSPMLAKSEAGGLRLYEFNQPMPVEGLQPLVAIEGSTLFFSTTRKFLDECRSTKPSLGDDADFKKALARVGSEGNGLSYVHPRLFQSLRAIETLNPNLPAEMKNYLGSIITQLPQIDQPLISLRINQPDGILVRSSWNRSLKQEIAMGAVYNPVTVGLLAAMAIPAFEKVREASQNRASPDQAVLNNLRQFANAGSQFCLDRGVITATYNDLVGPGKYIRVMTPVAGEDYRTLRFTMGQPLQIRLANGRVVELKP